MKYFYATVAAITVLTSTSGQAASQASLDVTGFTYQVVDLNPGNNIQPSLAYGSGYVPNYYSNVTTVQTWGSQSYPTYDYAGKGSYTLVQLPAPLVLPALTDSSVWLGGHSSGAIGTDASGNFIHLDAALVGQGTYSATTGSDMSGMLSPYRASALPASTSTLYFARQLGLSFMLSSQGHTARQAPQTCKALPTTTSHVLTRLACLLPMACNLTYKSCIPI